MKNHIKRITLAICCITLLSIYSGCSVKTQTNWTGITGIKIPWGDYEEAVYKYTANGKVTDDVKFIIEKLEQQGRLVYEMRTPIMLKEGEYVTGAVVDYETLKPLSSFVWRHPPEQYKDKKLDITGKYGDKLEIEAVSAKNTQKMKVNLKGECVDNESSVMTIRALPLETGYKKAMNLCIISTAKNVPYEIIVKDKEKVTVPFGNIECFKCEFRYKGILPSSTITLWYSADDKKHLIKYENGATIFELKSIKYEKSGE
jgi:Protein of unknown function (DUF3108).